MVDAWEADHYAVESGLARKRAIDAIAKGRQSSAANLHIYTESARHWARMSVRYAQLAEASDAR